MSLKTDILELVDLAKNEHSKTPKKVELSINVISSQEANKIKKVTGLTVKGYTRIIDNSGVKHCFVKHGGLKENLRGQLPIVDEDFLLIPLITRPENIINVSKNGQGLSVILYEYIQKDVFCYVEEVRTKRKKLALQSMYKRKPPLKKGR